MPITYITGHVDGDDSPIRVRRTFPEHCLHDALDFAHVHGLSVFVRDELGDSDLEIALVLSAVADELDALESSGQDFTVPWGRKDRQAFEGSPWYGTVDERAAWAVWRAAWAQGWLDRSRIPHAHRTKDRSSL